MKQLIFNTSDFIKSDIAERRTNKFNPDIGHALKVTVALKAEKISDDTLHISGGVEGYIEMECARCLSVYRYPVELYIETDMYFLDGEVDMDEEIRQRIILDLPSKPLCSQDCMGICPKCGKHNTENDKCSCNSDNNDEFIKHRWENLFKKNKKVSK